MAADKPQFERYTERAYHAVLRAREEAQALGHAYVGTEHLLLGLLTDDGGIPLAALEERDLTAPRARAQIVRLVGTGSEPGSAEPPFTPRFKRLLLHVPEVAEGLGVNYVDPTHVLLALLDEDGGVALSVLRNFGVDTEALRADVLRRWEARSLIGGRIAPEGGHGDGTRPDPRAAMRDAEPSEEPGSALEPVPTHVDRPATEDGLGRARLAEVLAERLRRVRGEDTERPTGSWAARREKLHRDRAAAARTGSFMVHVHAPWGAGKSSFLNFLAEDLRNVRALGGPWWKRVLAALQPRVPRDDRASQWIVAEFSAWRHQRLVPPWWWLLAAIRRSCGRELWRMQRGRWVWFHVRDLAWRAWNARAAWLAVLLAGALVATAAGSHWFGLEGRSLTAVRTAVLTTSAAFALGVALWGHIAGTSRWLAFGSADGAVRFLRRSHDPLGVYQRRFRWLVRSAGRPIAVFIDDLDRCKPAYVVELLEGIQTLFSDEPVSYVVAADRTWLHGSFASAYEAFRGIVGEPGRPLGFLFLEKTFQVSMEIPPMTFAGRDAYWRALMHPAARPAVGAADRREEAGGAAHVDFSDAQSEEQIERRIVELVAEGLREQDVVRAAVRKLNSPGMELRLEQLLSEFAPLVENNPRSMKRLLNAYGIERDRLVLERRAPTREERRELILLTILRLRWPLLAEHLARHPEDAELFGAEAPSPPPEHPFAALAGNRELRRLFDGELVDARLDVDVLRRHSGWDLHQPSSVGA